MLEAHRDTVLRRRDILRLCPQEVRSLIRSHLAVLRLLGLILSHLERICLDRTWLGIRIVTEEVYFRVVILVVDVVLRIPSVILGKGKLHIIGLVVLQKECSRGVTIVVNEVDTHNIARAETRVVNTSVIALVDITLD